MHVISASRRTDIPAFHTPWFMNRIRAGTVGVVSPFGGGAHDVSLAPDDVIAIVFWTKDAGPLLPHLDELTNRGYKLTFLYTINNYPLFMEPRVPSLGRTLRILETLHERLAKPVFRWRYDTIVLTEALDRKWHVRNFRHLCDVLSPHTTECIFSFCDYYRKTVRNMERLVPDHIRPDEHLSKELTDELAEVAEERGITMASCAHDFLVTEKVKKARCIDPEVLFRLVDTAERKRAVSDLKITPTRKDCGCAASRDIGAYDTCLHGCVYCYANGNPDRVAASLGSITPESPSLDFRYAKIRGGE